MTVAEKIKKCAFNPQMRWIIASYNSMRNTYTSYDELVVINMVFVDGSRMTHRIYYGDTHAN